MGLLIAAALGVIAFLLVEGTKANGSTSPQSPVTGAAGAPASSPNLSDLLLIPPARPSQQSDLSAWSVVPSDFSAPSVPLSQFDPSTQQQLLDQFWSGS